MWKTAFKKFPSNFLKAVFNNFYLVRSWILCLISSSQMFWYKKQLQENYEVITSNNSKNFIYHRKCLKTNSGYTITIRKQTNWNLFHIFIILSKTVIRKCSVKRCSKNFCKIHRKIRVSKSSRPATALTSSNCLCFIQGDVSFGNLKNFFNKIGSLHSFGTNF